MGLGTQFGGFVFAFTSSLITLRVLVTVFIAQRFKYSFHRRFHRNLIQFVEYTLGSHQTLRGSNFSITFIATSLWPSKFIKFHICHYHHSRIAFIVRSSRHNFYFYDRTRAGTRATHARLETRRIHFNRRQRQRPF
jgi:hypothetical protein